jgi:hypothetical protein
MIDSLFAAQRGRSPDGASESKETESPSAAQQDWNHDQEIESRIMDSLRAAQQG